MHQLRLLHMVLLTKMPPHNSRFPSSFNGASFQKAYRVVQILFSFQRTSAPSTVSAVIVATVVLPVSHKHSHPADQLGYAPLPGLEEQKLITYCTHNPLQSSARAPTSGAWSQFSAGTQNSSQLPPAQQPHVSTSKWDNTPAQPRKGTPASPLRESNPPSVLRPVLVKDHSPKPVPGVLPMVRFGQPKPPGHGTLHNAENDLMHHQYRLSVLQWNPGPTRKKPTQIIAAACGRFHAVILQEASDHAPTTLGPSHRVHWRHRPCHLAQQGHI